MRGFKNKSIAWCGQTSGWLPSVWCQGKHPSIRPVPFSRPPGHRAFIRQELPSCRMLHIKTKLLSYSREPPAHREDWPQRGKTRRSEAVCSFSAPGIPIDHSIASISHSFWAGLGRCRKNKQTTLLGSKLESKPEATLHAFAVSLQYSYNFLLFWKLELNKFFQMKYSQRFGIHGNFKTWSYLWLYLGLT